MKKEFEGIFPAVCTVSDNHGKLDEESQRNLIRFLIKKGVDGLAMSIFGGEFYKFSDSERKRLIEIAVDEANGKVPVLFGASHFTTFPSIELGKYAEDAGADGLIVTPPLFAPGTSTSYVEKHYKGIASAVNIPIMIQDAEGTVPFHMCSTFIAKLFKNEHIKYAKLEGAQSLTKMQEISELTGGKMILFGGMWGSQLIKELMLGAKGNIPGSALPELTVEPYKEYKKGNIEKAEKVFDKYRPFFEFRKLYPYMEIQKEILKIRGVISSSYVRVPAGELEEEATPKLKKLLEEINII